MTFQLADRVQESTMTVGTGMLALGGPLAQSQSFANGIGVGNTTWYCLVSGDGIGWETGVGTIGGVSGAYTLARSQILSSSNGGAPIAITDTSVVFCDIPASVVGIVRSAALGLVLNGSTVALAPIAADSFLANSTNATAVPVATTTTTDFVFNSGVFALNSALRTTIVGSEQTANKAQPSGYASLDSGGHVPSSQLPSSLLGGLIYAGVWNATTNTPNLTGAAPTSGTYYIISVAGTTSITTRSGTVTEWTPGDMLISDGGFFNKIDGSPTEVSSVLGQNGAISLLMLVEGGVAPSVDPILSGVTLSDIPNAPVLSTGSAGQIIELALAPSLYNNAGTIGALWNAGTITSLSGMDVIDEVLTVSVGGLQDTDITTPQPGDMLYYNGTDWINGRPQYILSGYFLGIPGRLQQIFGHRFAEAATIPTNFGMITGATSAVSTIECFTTATNDLTLTINRCLADSDPTIIANWIPIGTAVIPAGGYAAELFTNSGTVVVFGQKDRLDIVSGATPDVTASNFCVTLSANR